jgi:subtilisin family serine protease
VPGDIAQLTSASAAHREGATGRGVKVALIDTGFFPHRYYVNHRYKFAPTAVGPTDPTADPIDHGTSTLANLFACAPDVEAYAIKPAGLVELAIDYARTLPIRVLSLSWGHDCIGIRTFPTADLFPLWLRIILTVADGISVVAAAGNGEMHFPAMMPEVMAVGGVAVAADDAHTVWPNTSSFVSPIYPRRYVPDFCGIASEIMLPIAGPASWAVKPGTSWATPQIAGVCALMIQKDPTLTPDVIRNRLIETAIDITSGNSINVLPDMPSQPASRGNDRATGAGLVNAFEAWRRV